MHSLLMYFRHQPSSLASHAYFLLGNSLVKLLYPTHSTCPRKSWTETDVSHQNIEKTFCSQLVSDCSKRLASEIARFRPIATSLLHSQIIHPGNPGDGFSLANVMTTPLLPTKVVLLSRVQQFADQTISQKEIGVASETTNPPQRFQLSEIRISDKPHPIPTHQSTAMNIINIL